MTTKKAFCLILCFFITATNIHSKDEYGTLHIKLPVCRFYDQSKIQFINEQAYLAVIQKWQNKLQKGFKKLFSQLTQDINLSATQLQECLTNPNLIVRYHFLKTSEFPMAQDQDWDQEDFCYLEENDIDPEILNFIKSTIYKHTSKRNIKIILTSQIPNLTATYGSDLVKHYLFCNSNMYTKKNIHNYYNSLRSGHGFFYLERSENNSIRAIETSNLLQCGLIEAAARIEHQASLVSFLISHYTFHGQRAKNQTVLFCVNLHDLLCKIEAVLQSINPLESALFLYKSSNGNEPDHSILKRLVQNIAASYHPNSIKKFKNIMAQMKD